MLLFRIDHSFFIQGTFTSLTQLAGYLPLDIEEDNVKDIIDDTRVLGDDTVHTPGLVEPTPTELDDDNFPDFFNVDTNDWDEDWDFESDDDDIPNHGVGRIPPLENIEGFQESKIKVDIRGGSRISGKGVHIHVYKGVGFAFF